MDWLQRSKEIVSTKFFNQLNPPVPLFNTVLNCPYSNQQILRMKVREPHGEFKLPVELNWVEPLLFNCDSHMKASNIRHSYCYITVRHGPVQSVTDDEWHTDGYSEVLTHIPEQNYIVTNAYPTEFLEMPIAFPSDFNALQHNIVDYINKEVTLKDPKVRTAEANKVYIFDPYVIHRRPVESFGRQRTFVRITFVPVEIYDDACTQNSCYPIKKYNRIADTTRSKLVKYKE